MLLCFIILYYFFLLLICIKEAIINPAVAPIIKPVFIFQLNITNNETGNSKNNNRRKKYLTMCYEVFTSFR